MRGTKAKRIRRAVWDRKAPRRIERTYYHYRGTGRGHICDRDRQEYQWRKAVSTRGRDLFSPTHPGEKRLRRRQRARLRA